ncbi:MAG: 2TM domain-containing protein [Chitinophagaceae bacterium]|nr:MAG: 2TM domain-containing protein [Chitinophagaceae bacterium]
MLTEQQKDDELWQIAKARASFRWNLISYFFVNAFLVAIWLLSSRGPGSHFWPVWPILGWGLGLSLQYFHAFHGNQLINTRKEYEKIKNANY